MATVTWIGAGQIVAQVDTITIGSATSGHTFICTFGNGKTITYTAGTGETTTTVTAALLALLQAATDGEITEFSFESPTATTIRATGPADGTPCTLSVSGTGTIALVNTYTPSSPNDANNADNYSGGALPSNSDILVFENGSIDVKWNLDALAAIAVTFIRRASYTGSIGLPALNARNYSEYRTRYLSVKSASITNEQPSTDAAGQIRILNVTTGGATTVIIVGPGGAGRVGNEAMELYGTPASSVVDVAGGSVSVAALAGQTAAVGTLNAADASVTLGSGVTFGTGVAKNVSARIACNWTSLTMVEGGDVDITDAAAGANTGTFVYAGALRWKSTGATGNSPVVGNAGTIDFSQAPGSVTVGGTVSLSAGATWNDPRGVCGSYNVNLNKCRVQDVALVVGTNRTLAVS